MEERNILSSNSEAKSSPIIMRNLHSTASFEQLKSSQQSNNYNHHLPCIYTPQNTSNTLCSAFPKSKKSDLKNNTVINHNGIQEINPTLNTSCDNISSGSNDHSHIFMTEIDQQSSESKFGASSSSHIVQPKWRRSMQFILERMQSSTNHVEDVELTNVLDPPISIRYDLLLQSAIKNIRLHDKATSDVFRKYFNSEVNHQVLSRMFWFVFCAFFRHEKLEQQDVEDLIKELSSLVTHFFWIMHKNERDTFFSIYHFAVSYCIVKALRKHFPGSRIRFTKKMQIRVFELVSELFTGIRLRKSYIKTQKRKLFPPKVQDMIESTLKLRKTRTDDRKDSIASSISFLNTRLGKKSPNVHQNPTDRHSDSQVVQGENTVKDQQRRKSNTSESSSQNRMNAVLYECDKGFYSSDEEEYDINGQGDSDSEDDHSSIGDDGFFHQIAPIEDKILFTDDQEEKADDDWEVNNFLRQISNPAKLEQILSKEGSEYIDPSQDYVRESTKNLKRNLRKHLNKRNVEEREMEISMARAGGKKNKRPHTIGSIPNSTSKIPSPRFVSDQLDRLLEKMQSKSCSYGSPSKENRFWNTYGLSPLIGGYVREPIEFFHGHQVRLLSRSNGIHNAHFFGSRNDAKKRDQLIRNYKRNWVEPPSHVEYLNSLKRQAKLKEIHVKAKKNLKKELDRIKDRQGLQMEEIEREKREILQDKSGEKLYNLVNSMAKKGNRRNVDISKKYISSKSFKGTQLAAYASESASKIARQLKALDKKLDRRNVTKNDKNIIMKYIKGFKE